MHLRQNGFGNLAGRDTGGRDTEVAAEFAALSQKMYIIHTYIHIYIYIVYIYREREKEQNK